MVEIFVKIYHILKLKKTLEIALKPNAAVSAPPVAQQYACINCLVPTESPDRFV